MTGNKKEWKKDNRLSLGGVLDIALDRYIKRNTNIKNLAFCLDNDEAGKIATDRMTDKYKKLGFEVTSNTSELENVKDFNDMLITYKNVGIVKKKSLSLEM